MQATKNVLICEDDPVQLKVLTAMIQQAGYRSLAARTPGEAVVAARRCEIDAVLTDVQLQDGNAFELLGDLRRMGLDAPVLMTSAHATDGIRKRAMAAGARCFLDKPLSYAAIKSRVDDVLKAPKTLGATVLLLESHPKSRAELEVFVAQAGFKVIAVDAGSRVLDLLRSDGARIDLLLMDLHGKGLCGGELIREALALVPGLHVVAISGDAKREDIRAAYDAGAASYVRKPISGERLASFLKASLHTARDHRKLEVERQSHTQRLAKESAFRKAVRWIKSCFYAPSESRKGSVLRAAGCFVLAVAIGAGVAAGVQQSAESLARYESVIERALQGALQGPPAGGARREAVQMSVRADEQINLMRESNDFTRRYYQDYLHEMRRQARQASEVAPAPVPTPISIPEGFRGGIR